MISNKKKSEHYGYLVRALRSLKEDSWLIGGMPRRIGGCQIIMSDSTQKDIPILKVWISWVRFFNQRRSNAEVIRQDVIRILRILTNHKKKLILQEGKLTQKIIEGELILPKGGIYGLTLSSSPPMRGELIVNLLELKCDVTPPFEKEEIDLINRTISEEFPIIIARGTPIKICGKVEIMPNHSY